MPADFTLVRESRTVHSRAWGALTDADLYDHLLQIARLFQEGVLDGDWAQLCDFTGVGSLDGVSSQGIRRMAEQNPWPRFNVRAFVVSNDEQFGLARMYQSMGDPKTADLCISRSTEEAVAFIGRERVRLGIAI